MPLCLVAYNFRVFSVLQTLTLYWPSRMLQGSPDLRRPQWQRLLRGLSTLPVGWAVVSPSPLVWLCSILSMFRPSCHWPHAHPASKSHGGSCSKPPPLSLECQQCDSGLSLEYLFSKILHLWASAFWPLASFLFICKTPPHHPSAEALSLLSRGAPLACERLTTLMEAPLNISQSPGRRQGEVCLPWPSTPYRAS